MRSNSWKKYSAESFNCDDTTRPTTRHDQRHDQRHTHFVTLIITRHTTQYNTHALHQAIRPHLELVAALVGGLDGGVRPEGLDRLDDVGGEVVVVGEVEHVQHVGRLLVVLHQLQAAPGVRSLKLLHSLEF
jgi:hypothetical protein